MHPRMLMNINTTKKKTFQVDKKKKFIDKKTLALH